jgi:hypothetical protein
MGLVRTIIGSLLWDWSRQDWSRLCCPRDLSFFFHPPPPIRLINNPPPRQSCPPPSPTFTRTFPLPKRLLHSPSTLLHHQILETSPHHHPPISWASRCIAFRNQSACPHPPNSPDHLDLPHSVHLEIWGDSTSSTQPWFIHIHSDPSLIFRRLCSLITITTPALSKKCLCETTIHPVVYAPKNQYPSSTVHSVFSSSRIVYMKPMLSPSSSADLAKCLIHLHQLPSYSSILLSTLSFSATLCSRFQIELKPWIKDNGVNIPLSWLILFGCVQQSHILNLWNTSL